MGVCVGGWVVVACVSVLCVFVLARARVCMRVCACLCLVQLCKVCASSVLAFAVMHLLLLAYVCMYLDPCTYVVFCLGHLITKPCLCWCLWHLLLSRLNMPVRTNLQYIVNNTFRFYN